MAERENYYILLNLDPSVTSESQIISVISKKQSEWNRLKTNGAIKQRVQADRYVKMIPQIKKVLLDASLRKAEAEAAQEILKQVKGEQLEKLDSLIDALLQTRSDKVLEAKFVAHLEKQASGFSRQEIEDRLKHKGFRIEITAKPKPRPKKETLKNAVFNEICGNLELVACEDLYAFLEMSNRSSAKALYDVADQISKEINRLGKTDGLSTSRKVVAGHAMAVFCNEVEKQKYDNTLAQSQLRAFDSMLEVFGGLDKYIDQGELTQYLNATRQKGITADDAMEYLQGKAEKKKWQVYTGQEKIPVFPMCGYCGKIAGSNKEQRCTGCGEELVKPCPRCNHPVPTEHRSCQKCGCNTGDAPLIKELLQQGEDSVIRGEFKQGIETFERILLLWKDWDIAKRALAKAKGLRQEREKQLRHIRELESHKRFEEASGELAEFIEKFGNAQIAGVRQRIEQGFGRAQKLYLEAEELSRKGQKDAAIEKHLQVLGACSDFSPSLSAMADSPPPAPEFVQTHALREQVRLSWPAVQTKGSIRYVVIRKKYSAPIQINDGEQIAEISGTTFTDRQVDGGIPWVYSVFTVRGGTPSHEPAATDPILIPSEVKDIEAIAGDSHIFLRFQKPPTAKEIEIWRQKGGAPEQAGIGKRLSVDADSLVDQGLANEQLYGYLVIAVFSDPVNPKRTIRSKGKEITATPIKPPAPLGNLTTKRKGRSLSIQWNPPPASVQVQLRISSVVPDYTPGQIVPLQHTEKLGTSIHILEQDKTLLEIQEQQQVFLIPITIQAQTAVLGHWVEVNLLDDVKHLNSTRSGKELVLTWDWPRQVQEIQVCIRSDGYPEGPNDPKSRQVSFTRTQYNRTNSFETTDETGAPHYFTVYAFDSSKGLYSSGVRTVEAGRHIVRVSYEVHCNKTLFRRSVKEAWIQVTCKGDLVLPTIGVYIDRKMPPISTAVGTLVKEVPELVLAEGSARIDLPVEQLSLPGYIKLFFKDSASAKEFRLLPAAQDKLRVG